MRFSFQFIIISLFVFTSCSSGRYYSDRTRTTRASRVDSKPYRTSGLYRVKGSDELGKLSANEKSRLRSVTQSWRWPLQEVEVTSSFGIRHGDFHDGVDLRAPIGTRVYAAAPGVVIYSGSRISGYGKMLVIRHQDKLSTVYAHNSKLLVRKGQKVRRGQLIAYSGNTGRSSGPHVHFEVRKGIVAINPISLLVSPQVVNSANRRIASSESRRSKRSN